MTSYNTGRYVEEAVYSSLAHNVSDRPLELLLIDDGSNCNEMLQALKRLENVDNVRVFRESENKGTSTARNIAISHAKYPYLVFIDSDDAMNNHPNLLAKGSYYDRGIQALKDNSKFMCVYSDYFAFGADYYYNSLKIGSEKDVLTGGGPMSYMVCRKDDVLNSKKFDEQISHNIDYAFYITLMNSNSKMGKGVLPHIIEEPYYLYRQHNDGSNMGARRRNWIFFFERLCSRNFEIFSKHYPAIDRNNMASEMLKKRSKFPIKKHFSMAVEDPKWFVKKMLKKMALIFLPRYVVNGIKVARREYLESESYINIDAHYRAK